MSSTPPEPEPTQPYFQPPGSGQPARYPAEPNRWDDPGHPAAPSQSYGQPYETPYPQYHPQGPQPYGYPDGVQKSRLAAALLAIFLGGFGVHNFYLGRTGIAVLQLLLTVLSLGLLAPLVWIWVIIEAILILTRSPGFATDAKGIPLRD